MSRIGLTSGSSQSNGMPELTSGTDTSTVPSAGELSGTDSGNSECQYGNPFGDLAIDNELLVVGVSGSDDGAFAWNVFTDSDETQHTSDDGLGMGVVRNQNEMIYVDDQVMDINNIEHGVEYLPSDDDERAGSSPVVEDRDGGARESFDQSQVSNEDTNYVEDVIEAGEDDLRNEGIDEEDGARIQIKNLN